MGELVNLKRLRKRRRREESEKAARLNRAKFGRTKAERDNSTANADRAANALDQLKLSKEVT